ncbi:phage tail tape measure protein [Herbiconiux sp. CPCC 205716]|uniref:Phage tail tape measure protein n=1 Tax=Herbiconiux gentiana TaxID=2970912 RepID=A0ABT2GFX4_9MICO|nr:phage tail tape measure protein [Herbiconiux gentiana]MCS5715115.1 phage tail tape measure protein [Herbiconiux gentiana]
MADRVVKVTLSAQVSNYLAAMEQARKKTVDFADSANKEIGKSSTSIRELSGGMLAIGAAAGAGVALAVKKFADFDQQLSAVKAATHESAENMDLLRDAALRAGASTVYSATEAAQSIEELSKAGISTADVLDGGLTGALDLAAAGNLEVADAAGIAATALQTFGLKGSDVSHVADLLAAGAGKAMGDVTDLAAALNQGGLVAQQTGLSIEETTAALAAFASKGLLGSDAGTSFKTMLQSLTPSSAEAREAMEKYNLTAYDAQGQFIGLEAYAGKLKDGLSGLTTEQQNATLKTIFGADAVRAASVLYQEGSEGIREWTEAVNDQGYAAETAATRLDNLNGDIEALGGALDTALIETGSSANDVLRDLVQNVTDAVDGFNDLPDPVKDAILGVAGFTAGAGLLAGAAGFGVVKLAELRDAFTTITTQMPITGRALSGVANVLTGPWGLAIAAASVIGLQFLQINADQQQAVDDLSASLDENTGAFTKNTRQLVINQLEADGTFNLARKAGIGLDIATDAALGNRDAMAQVDAIAQKYAATVKDGDFDILGDINQDQYQTLTDRLSGQNEKLSEAQAQWRDNKEAMGDAGETADDTAIAIEGVGTVSQKAADDINALADQILGFGKANLDTRDATRQFEQAIDDIEEAMGAEGWTATLDDSEAAGRANNEMLDSLASSTLALSSAIVTQTGDTEAARDAMEKGRAEFISTATEMGLTEDAAKALADQVGLIPTDVVTNVTLTGAETMSDRIASIVSFWEARGINIPAYVIRQDEAAANRGPDGYATGGPIYGPGSGTSDDIIIRASNGEYMIRASEASSHRALLDGINGGLGAVGLASLAAQDAATNGLYPSTSMDLASAAEIYGVNDAALRYGTPVQPTYVTAGGAAAGSGSNVTFNQTINPSTAMSEELIGRSAAAYATRKLRGRMA